MPTAHDDAPLTSWRALGDVLANTGDVAGALAAYEGYLHRAGDAPDRWLVEASIDALRARK